MPIDFLALKNELQNDPLGLGYASYIASGDQYNIYVILTKKIFTNPARLPIDELSEYLDFNKISVKIQNNANNSGVPIALQDECKFLLRVLHARYDTIDTTNNGFRFALQVLQSGNILNNSQRQNIINSMPNKPASRSEVLFGEDVTTYDVSFVLNKLMK